MAEADEAVSRGTYLFPEPSVNASIVGYCGNSFKYYMLTSSRISYACVHIKTDTNPPTEGERERKTGHQISTAGCIAIHFLFKVILKLFLSIINIRHKAKNKFWKY